MSDDIFANLPRKAEVLGEPLAYYPMQRGSWLRRLLVNALVHVALGTAVGWLAVGYYVNRGEDAGAGSVVLLTLGLVIGVLFCVIGIVPLIAARALGGGNVLGIVHCPRGLVCVLTEKSLVVPWDEIDSIWENGRRFRIRGGAEVALPPIVAREGTICRLVLEETFQRLAVCASAMILGGRSVEFGPVTVTRNEIVFGDQRVACADVTGMAVTMTGMLRISGSSERLPALDIPVRLVPNVHVMLALVERIREGGFGSIVIGPAASEPPDFG